MTVRDAVPAEGGGGGDRSKDGRGRWAFPVFLFHGRRRARDVSLAKPADFNGASVYRRAPFTTRSGALASTKRADLPT